MNSIIIQFKIAFINTFGGIYEGLPRLMMLRMRKKTNIHAASSLKVKVRAKAHIHTQREHHLIEGESGNAPSNRAW
jgi:hypothetical protein